MSSTRGSKPDATDGIRIERISIERLNPAPYNPRVELRPGDPRYEKLRRSIETFGCVDPLVWNQRSGNLVGGHQRLTVLKDLRHTHADVSVVDLSPEDEKALNLALNKVSGDWDEQKLARVLEELTELPEFDVGLTGFEYDESSALVAEHLQPPLGDEENFDLEAELESDRPTVTEPGELIILGRHRLLCGDSTDPEQVRQLMDGHRAIVFATDPPYLVNYDGTNHPNKRKTANKNWAGSYGITWDDAEANPDLYEKFIGVAIAEAIAENAAWYCWHASKRQAMVESVWEQHGAFVHQQIIWKKDRPVLNRSWFTWQHEPCFFGWRRPNQPPRRSKEHLPTVWEAPTVAPGQRTDHPTSKPTRLFEIPLLQHSRPGEICYEPFCGSGSQLIAAERLGRRCFAVEISPRYCDVIIRRYIAFVGVHNSDPELVDRYCGKGVAS